MEWININETQDYNKIGYKSPNNYRFSNQIIYKNFIPAFYSPVTLTEGVDDVEIEEMTINPNTGVTSWDTFLGVSTGFNDKYFQGYTLEEVSYLTPNKFYRIKITIASTGDNYISSQIFKCINDTLTESITATMTDIEGYTFVDSEGYAHVETF